MDDLFAKFHETVPWGQTLESSFDARDIHLKSDRISSPNEANFTRKSQKLFLSISPNVVFTFSITQFSSVNIFQESMYLVVQ
jgi:hypothetical protein